MKTVIKLGAFVLLTFALITSCTKEGPMGPQGEQGIQGEQGPKGDPGQDGEDAQTDIPQAYGTWEIIEAAPGDPTKYIYINEDNTINILSEDSRGFRSVKTTNVVVTENQIIYEGIFNYTVNQDILTISLPYSEDPVQLQYVESVPEVFDFVKPIGVLEQGMANWDQSIDIAFDDTYILGWDSSLNAILKIDPSDFSIADQIPTTNAAYAIELEKSDGSFRQFFQSNNGSSTFNSYIYSSLVHYYTSESVASWISGIAYMESQQLWISSSSTDKLYKYKSNGSLTPGEILETIELEFRPRGLNYSNGFLFIASGSYIFKCQTSTELMAVETYQLKGHDISGITFDGNNFWVAARDTEYDEYKLLKTDIGL